MKLRATESRSAKTLTAVALVAVVAATLGLTDTAGATGNGRNREGDKVAVCHVTNSSSNPYVLVWVATDAFDGEGDNDHTRHISSDGRVDVLATDGACPPVETPSTTEPPATGTVPQAPGSETPSTTEPPATGTVPQAPGSETPSTTEPPATGTVPHAPGRAPRSAPIAGQEHICISFNGVELVRSGTASCVTEAGSRSWAVARGNGSRAEVRESSRSRAVAINGGQATVVDGHHNTAVAEGDLTGAWAFGGEHNWAIAMDGAFFAGAGFIGAGPNPDSSHNRAVAIGPDSRADAAFGDHNHAIAKSGGHAEAAYGNFLMATAIGTDSVAGACGTDHLKAKARAGEILVIGCP